MAYSRLSEELYNLAKYWAGEWTRLAQKYAISTPEEGIPRRIPLKISTRVERKSAQRFALILTARGTGAKLKEWGGDYARAFEFGSGIHSEKGGGKYPIRPRKAKFLVFPWDKAYEYIPRTSDGKVMLAAVNHPGVKAASGGQGYIRPAARELLDKGEAQLGKLAKKAILADLRGAFKERRRR